MTDLLMLGIIPGTNIQISFANWLTCTVLLSRLLFLYVAHRKRVATILILLVALHLVTRRIKLVPSA